MLPLCRQSSPPSSPRRRKPANLTADQGGGGFDAPWVKGQPGTWWWGDVLGLLGLATLSILPRARSRWPRASAGSSSMPVRWVETARPKAEAD